MSSVSGMMARTTPYTTQLRSTPPGARAAGAAGSADPTRASRAGARHPRPDSAESRRARASSVHVLFRRRRRRRLLVEGLDLREERLDVGPAGTGAARNPAGAQIAVPVDEEFYVGRSRGIGK